MRVLVTGASGNVGRYVAREFLERGYTVRCFDRTAALEELRGRVEAVYGDLRDRYALFRAVEGCEAIAHLAAIPHPQAGEDEIFPVNGTGTQWLLDAAEAFGVRRVALASTNCTYGFVFARHPVEPQRLPLREDHPLLPQDMYGLSKVLNELTAAAYTRRCGMTTVALRLTTVVYLDRIERLRWWKAGLKDDGYRRDLWGYADARDVGRAFRLAIENAPEGTHTVANLAARDALTALDIRELVKRHLPARAAEVEGLSPEASLFDTRCAAEAFGFVAEHSWRSVPELKDESP